MLTTIALTLFSWSAAFNLECWTYCEAYCPGVADTAVCGITVHNGMLCTRCKCLQAGEPWPHWPVADVGYAPWDNDCEVWIYDYD